MNTSATHILAAMFEGRITTTSVVVQASNLSSQLTNMRLDAAYNELRDALARIEAQEFYEALYALNRAYTALGASNPLPDVVSLRLGYHPLLLVRAGKQIGGSLVY